MNLKVSTTAAKQVVDITPDIQNMITEKGFQSGLVVIFVKHTTCALATADLDPGTDCDYLDAIERMFPQGKYRHPHNPAHVGEHIMSSIIGGSVIVPVEEARLDLGTWQRVVLVELSGPRDRALVVKFIPG